MPPPTPHQEKDNASSSDDQVPDQARAKAKAESNGNGDKNNKKADLMSSLLMTGDGGSGFHTEDGQAVTKKENADTSSSQPAGTSPGASTSSPSGGGLFGEDDETQNLQQLNHLDQNHNNQEEDLFGDAPPIVDAPTKDDDDSGAVYPGVTSTSTSNDTATATATVTPAVSSNQVLSVAPTANADTRKTAPSSLLSKSGLLGSSSASSTNQIENGFPHDKNSGGDGDLFAAVDEEEAEKERIAEEARRKAAQEAEEAAAAAAAQEAERQRQLVLQQQQQRQQAMNGHPNYQSYAYPSQIQNQHNQSMSASFSQPAGGGNGHDSRTASSFQQKSAAMMSQSMMVTPTHLQQQVPGSTPYGQIPGQTQGQTQNQLQTTPRQSSNLNSQFDQMNLGYRDHSSSITMPNPSSSAEQHQYGYNGNTPLQQPGNGNAYRGGMAATPSASLEPGRNSYHYETQHQPPPMTPQRAVARVPPANINPLYTQIVVNEPMLIQSPNYFLVSSPPYWSYQISSNLANNQGTWLVRRRFRHVVALEDRLREACPGAILPPRPEKHATRALEEASTQQSAEFAIARAQELSTYLNALAKHPIAGQSQPLKLFLGLQDDIGTAWPEVSGNALTRLGAVGVGVSMKVAEKVPLPGVAPVDWEDNAELLALMNSEQVRMGAVVTAVPKLEGTIALYRDLGDARGAIGMELSKFSKAGPELSDMAKPSEILSNGLLRQGRRTKRLALELSAALETFVAQYKMVPYEKQAFMDRKHALQRRGHQRRGADSRAQLLMQQQQQHQQFQTPYGQSPHSLDQLERTAVSMDQYATAVANEADEIAGTIQQEVNRIGIQRRIEWLQSCKVMASAMKEASSENLAIWQSTSEAFSQAFPPEENGKN